jgi:hypothetical protein
VIAQPYVKVYIHQLQEGAKASVYDDESQSKEERMMTTLIILGRSRAVNENERNTFLDSAFSMRVSCPFPRIKQAQPQLLEYDAAVTRSGPQTGHWVYMIDFLDRFDEPTPSAVYMREQAEGLTPAERTTLASLWCLRVPLRLMD